MKISKLAEVDESDKVISGHDGWLFLGNDANHSAAQFSGELNLSEKSIDKFRGYLDSLKRKISCNFLFSISPNKEYVVPEKYPFLNKGKSCGKLLVHEQIVSVLIESDVHYHYPVEELSRIPNGYYKTDTHWSEYGAYTVLKSVFIDSYGVNLVELGAEKFVMNYVAGDLGSKLNGQKDGRLSYNFKVDEYEVFNSGLKNHGFGVHYMNRDAPDRRKVIVFGDSFGISYIPPLVLTFAEVVFLYSPATFIEEIYDCFKPDFVIFQINQRFLLEPPVYRYKLESSLVFKKFKKFEDREIRDYIKARKVETPNSFLKDSYLRGLLTLLP